MRTDMLERVRLQPVASGTLPTPTLVASGTMPSPTLVANGIVPRPALVAEAVRSQSGGLLSHAEMLAAQAVLAELATPRAEAVVQ